MQGDGSNQRKKRGRGTVKGLAAATKRVKDRTQKLQIEFSSRLGGPVGPNARTFVDEVVLFTRKRAPLIGVNSWKDIKEDVKNVIAEEILVRCVLFFIPTRVMRKINRLKPFDCFLIVNRLGGTSSTLPLRMKQKIKYGTLPRSGTKDGDQL